MDATTSSQPPHSRTWLERQRRRRQSALLRGARLEGARLAGSLHDAAGP